MGLRLNEYIKSNERGRAMREGLNIVATSEGGRIGHCDLTLAPCKTLGCCWGHELPQDAR